MDSSNNKDSESVRRFGVGEERGRGRVHGHDIWWSDIGIEM